MSDEVTLAIDGHEVTVPKGTLVIRAAEQVGVYIPRFCDHPLLDPLGACRQCLVEIEGQRKPLTACTTHVADGMVVKTQASSELAEDAQRAVLELLLINHPLDCPMCDKGGECPLQDQALAYGPGGSRYVDPKRRFTKPVPISPLVRLDRERCVLCARCTRFADEISGEPFIELFERGALEQVAIFEDQPYRDVFSGNVIQICPVGALTSSTFRFLARPFDVTTTPSTCNRCASGCAIDLQERRGEIVRVLARQDLAVNDEWICDKGRFGYAYNAAPERVTEPLVRKGEEYVAVSWAEAVEEVARGIREARAAGRPAAVLGGAQLAVEDAYALSRFARTVLGTNDVDFRTWQGGEEEERLLVALPRTVTARNEDIDRAHAIVVAGIDLREESPILFLRVRKAWRNGGARVHEVSPRRTLQKAGARWTPCRPGEEAAALRALLDDAELRAAAQDVVVLAGERLAASPGAPTAAWNLAAALGGRFGWVARKAGARGAVEAGLHPALLPGGRSVRWAPQRAQVEEVWGGPVPELVGRGVREVLAGDDLGVVWLAGADPARDLPGGARALERAAFVVAQDLFLTDSAVYADVVLPAASGYERAGTLLNWEGRALPLAAVVPPAGLSMPDHEILAGVAEALGAAFPRALEALRREIRALPPDARQPEPLPEVEMRAPAGDGLALLTYRPLVDDGTMMAGADALRASAEQAFVEMHGDDARGLASGDRVRVASARGSVEGELRLRSDAIARGTVFVPGALALLDGDRTTVTVERA